ncbi:gluconate 2-dehydrogenase subunit 3 family protein [Phenylobacterium sp.]|uniref:gluconate 2-dehydrogenase subunit 3 family protein n=1 Tax=Phenylobacterium sp. TaxID=1871053 RepID=UPI00286D17BB|nr:gluconate 2-dehydrogenase subunit 3 family protein [Phenylobacterium sp.]
MATCAKLSRREAFAGVAFAGLAFTVGALSFGLAQPAAAQGLTWAPVALTPAQARALDAAAEQIMPATETPGARAAGVPQFVDRAIAGWCDKGQAALLRAGLDGLDADARAAHAAAFADLTAAEQTAILAGYDSSGARQRPFFLTLRELVTIGYFTSRPGATVALRYDPIPGPYRGCVPLKEIGRGWAI